MRLPFGLDLKTVVVTVLFLTFVLPWLMGLLSKRQSNANA
jgi:hypothetical protein